VMVVVDRGYTRIQKRWRRAAAAGLEVPLVQVETDVIVPVEAASPKEEYTAGTFRPKILRQLPLYPTKMTSTPARRDSLDLRFDTLDAERPDLLLNALDIDRRVAPSRDFKGGRRAGLRRFRRFLTNHLDEYAELGGDPAADRLSGLSPYLHFGQISPLEIAARVSLRSGPGREAFLEQLIVRRELSMNFVFYNSGYDRYAGLPEWCRRTLREHARDRRNPQYSPEELERAETHDPYRNAAQREMLDTGKMHGYMRMYWGKKILEWTDRPEEAFRIALTLNNRYELDGRDPNGFAGVAWCFGKHDRAWAERPIFGKVRYMNAAGLRRKFAIDEYVRRVSILSG